MAEKKGRREGRRKRRWIKRKGEGQAESIKCQITEMVRAANIRCVLSRTNYSFKTQRL